MLTLPVKASYRRCVPEYSFTLVGRERQGNSTTEEVRVDTSMLTTKLHPLLFTVHFNILLTVNKPTLNVTENFKNAVPGKKNHILNSIEN